MRIAVQQPYFAPYLNYFRLMRAVDVFVFLTDVQYVRRSWMNRNRIRSNAARGWSYLTVPLAAHDQRTSIRRIRLADPAWPRSCRQRLANTYGVLDHPALDAVGDPCATLAPYLCRSTTALARLLGARCAIADSADLRLPADLRGAGRLREICRRLGATEYLNLPGGRRLYGQDDLGNTALRFVDPPEGESDLSALDTLLTADGDPHRLLP